MQAAHSTSLRELIDTKLQGGPDPITLDELVDQLRDEGKSWARAANTISRRAGIDVSFESLRRWYGTGGGAAA